MFLQSVPADVTNDPLHLAILVGRGLAGHSPIDLARVL